MKDINVLYWECDDRKLLVSDLSMEYRVALNVAAIESVANFTAREYERNAEHKLEPTLEQEVVLIRTIGGNTLRCAFPPSDRGEQEAMKFFDALRNVV